MSQSSRYVESHSKDGPQMYCGILWLKERRIEESKGRAQEVEAESKGKSEVYERPSCAECVLRVSMCTCIRGLGNEIGAIDSAAEQ